MLTVWDSLSMVRCITKEIVNKQKIDSRMHSNSRGYHESFYGLPPSHRLVSSTYRCDGTPGIDLLLVIAVIVSSRHIHLHVWTTVDRLISHLNRYPSLYQLFHRVIILSRSNAVFVWLDRFNILNGRFLYYRLIIRAHFRFIERKNSFKQFNLREEASSMRLARWD